MIRLCHDNYEKIVKDYFDIKCRMEKFYSRLKSKHSQLKLVIDSRDSKRDTISGWNIDAYNEKTLNIRNKASAICLTMSKVKLFIESGHMLFDQKEKE